MNEEPQGCELDWPVWSIVAADVRQPIRSTSTSYAEAVRRVQVLEGMGATGLAVVTNFVAERIETRLLSSKEFDRDLGAIEDGEPNAIDAAKQHGRLAGYAEPVISELIERASNPSPVNYDHAANA